METYPDFSLVGISLDGPTLFYGFCTQDQNRIKYIYKIVYNNKHSAQKQRSALVLKQEEWSEEDTEELDLNLDYYKNGGSILDIPESTVSTNQLRINEKQWIRYSKMGRIIRKTNTSYTVKPGKEDWMLEELLGQGSTCNYDDL